MVHKLLLIGTFNNLSFDKTNYFYFYNFQTGFVMYLALIMKLFGARLLSIKIVEMLAKKRLLYPKNIEKGESRFGNTFGSGESSNICFHIVRKSVSASLLVPNGVQRPGNA